MDKKQEKKIWNSQLAIENPKNDRIAVIYSVKDDCLFILHFHAHDIIVHEIAVSYMMVPCAYFP